MNPMDKNHPHETKTTTATTIPSISATTTITTTAPARTSTTSTVVPTDATVVAAAFSSRNDNDDIPPMTTVQDVLQQQQYYDTTSAATSLTTTTKSKSSRKRKGMSPSGNEAVVVAPRTTLTTMSTSSTTAEDMEITINEGQHTSQSNVSMSVALQDKPIDSHSSSTTTATTTTTTTTTATTPGINPTTTLNQQEPDRNTIDDHQQHVFQLSTITVPVDTATTTATENNNNREPPMDSVKTVNNITTTSNNDTATTVESLSASSPTTATATTKTTPYESLRWKLVTNDGTPEALLRLIGVKSLFAKQLPKMPRAYIARLVLDRNHTSLVVLSDNPTLQNSDDEIIGSICYRHFASQKFAEIAFCAVHATHQVKGYGTKLMNLLKHIAVQQQIEYFITYADNYAIGYFKKQGFTKQITMPKGRYYGYIKDYDGGTPMECYIHPSVDYFNIPTIVQQQRQFILYRIARTALSLTTVYPPLTSEFILGGNTTTTTGSKSSGGTSSSSNVNHQASSATATGTMTTTTPALSTNHGTSSLSQQQQQQSFANDILAGSCMNTSIVGGGGISVSRANAGAARALTIPGMMEAGWTLPDILQAVNKSDDMKQKSTALKQELLSIVRKIEEQQFAWPFREPVTPEEAPDYHDLITNPIDLKTMSQRIRQDNHYKNKQMLYGDLMLMIHNCNLYNDDGSTYIQCATQLDKFIKTIFNDAVTMPVAMTTTTMMSGTNSASMTSESLSFPSTRTSKTMPTSSV
jgi:N-acetylglutamate synthase-like GNAT family acetyltransferase